MKSKNETVSNLNDGLKKMEKVLFCFAPLLVHQHLMCVYGGNEIHFHAESMQKESTRGNIQAHTSNNIVHKILNGDKVRHAFMHNKFNYSKFNKLHKPRSIKVDVPRSTLTHR